MNERELHDVASGLFLELRLIPPDRRAARLDAATAGNTRLREEVESLLRHDVTDQESPAPSSAQAPHLPETIGPYTIVRRIGSGGSGYVLLAEQHEPVRRRVAIKIVPHAAISPELALRFDFERRALERAVHPNIARVLDAGRTPDGLPYLVMDYVDGVPITAYCESRGLRLHERISLLLGVADAVQHAHVRGVIHRDLKPANILVEEISGRATPRVLDFGIAKPTPEAATTEESARTLGIALGTPSYMAPEQTGGHGVDTRADVYSLGAVLYELVCGRPPIETERAGAGAGRDRPDMFEVFRRIREETPPAPSRVRAANETLSRAESPPASLLADLDCITAKALEKSPERRYPTVGAFADDLLRLLSNEPITARRPTAAYRSAKFFRRHRALVLAAVVVAVAVIVGIVGLATGLVEARRQRREAMIQTEAQRELNRFLTEDLLGAASPEEQGENTTALELLHRASRKVDSRLGDRPLIAAAVHHALGSAYMQLGAFDDASRHVERAIELRRANAGADAPETVRSEIAGASLLARLQRMPEAEKALQESIRRARLILGPDDAALYTAINDLGTVYIGMDRGEDAVTTLRDALAGRKRLLGERDSDVLVTTGNLAQAFDLLGQTQRSLEMQLEALRIAEAMEEPPRMTLIGLCNNIGATYQDLEQDAEAGPYLRRAAKLASTWLGADNPATLMIQSNLAGLESELGAPERGAELYKAVVDAWTRTIGTDALDTLTARYGYWNSLRRAKRYDDAAAGYESLLGDMTRVLGAEHRLSVRTKDALARVLVEAGRPEEAEPHARAVLASYRAQLGGAHTQTLLTEELVKEIERLLAERGSGD